MLINGRRATSAVLADDAQRTYVDLNQIPLEAVERIEVLKDGASAIYGSDAVAGVVNIILRKNYLGTALKASYGISEEGDGDEMRAAVTHGFGDLGKDGYNVLLNFEVGKKDPIYYRDRMGRGSVGVSAIGQPQWGFDPNSGPTNNIPRAGGNGWIPTATLPSGRVNNSARPSIVGNVRNPVTNDYYSRSDPAGVGFTQTFPGAATFCNANANLPQNNPAGGCINDVRQAISQIQPEHETASFYGRLTKALSPTMEGFVELGYYHSQDDRRQPADRAERRLLPARRRRGLANGPDDAGCESPGQPVPRNGRPAHVSCRQFDTGTPQVNSKSDAYRFVAGVKGTWNAWDFDTGVVYSDARQTDTSTKTLNWRVKNALLNPTAAERRRRDRRSARHTPRSRRARCGASARTPASTPRRCTTPSLPTRSATAIRSCTAPTSRSRASSASSKAARWASPSAPRSAARTTSCLCTRAWAITRACRSRLTAAHGTSTPRMRRWPCPS